MTNQRAYALLLAVILFWAGNFPLSKLGLAELPPATITAVRAPLATAVFGSWAVWRSPLGLPPVWIMAGAHAVSAVVLVPLSLAIDPPWPSPARAPMGFAVVLYGALPVTLGHLWYYSIVRTIGPARASTFLNLMPFAVIVLTWAMLGEAVRAYHLVGAALVIGGVFLATRR
jgi:drug/metabolite transporter (DMT)-like permease